MSESTEQIKSDKVSGTTLGLQDSFLEILVCPIDHGHLVVTANGLTCDSCQRTYPVVNGIPNFVVEE